MRCAPTAQRAQIRLEPPTETTFSPGASSLEQPAHALPARIGALHDEQRRRAPTRSASPVFCQRSGIETPQLAQNLTASSTEDSGFFFFLPFLAFFFVFL